MLICLHVLLTWYLLEIYILFIIVHTLTFASNELKISCTYFKHQGIRFQNKVGKYLCVLKSYLILKICII